MTINEESETKSKEREGGIMIDMVRITTMILVIVRQEKEISYQNAPIRDQYKIERGAEMKIEAI